MPRQQLRVRDAQIAEPLGSVGFASQLFLRRARLFFGKLAERESLEQVIGKSAISHDASSSSAARSFKSRSRFRTPDTDIPTSAATSSRVRPSSM